MADGTVTIKANFDGKDAESGVSRIKSALSGLKDSGSKIGSVFKSVLGANLVSGAVSKGFGLITDGVRGMVGELSEASRAWKTFDGNMQILGKSQGQIDAVRGKLQSFATDSIYSASDMASTYAQLEAVGVKGADNLVMAFGGLAASAENPVQAMKSLSQQATQMAAKPTVAWGDFRIMMEQSPAGMAAVAKSMGMSMDQMVAAVQDGTISTKDFFEHIQKVAGEGTAFNNLAREAKDAGQALGGLTEGLGNQLLPAFQKIDGFAIKVLDKISEKLSKIDFGPMTEKIGKFLNGIDIDGLVNKIGNGISQIGQFFSNFASTGAFSALGQAFQSIGGAIKNVLSALGLGKTSFADFGTTLGNVVTKLAEGATKIADFIGKMDTGKLQSWMAAIAAVVGGFKLFNAVTGSSPVGALLDKLGGKFGLFKSKAQAGMDGAAGATRRSKGVIAQVFNGLGTLVKSAGTGIATAARGIGTGLQSAFSGVAVAAKGIGTGLAAAFRGIGQALAMANPANILALSVAIVAVGAAFALAGSQGQGIATIIQSLGSAFGQLASTIIGAFANAIVTVAGVLPIVASSLSMLSPLVRAVGDAIATVITAIGNFAPQLAVLVTAIGSAISGIVTSVGSALSGLVSAISSGVSQIISALTPIVAIFASTFVQVTQIVANAIVQIVQALAPFIPAVTEMVVALAPVLSQMVDAFNNLVSQISPILDSLSNTIKTFAEGVKTTLDGVKGVVDSLGGAIRSALDGVAGIFDSMGNAAKNAGQGVKLMAQGVKMLVDLNLADLGATLTAVATGLGSIAGHSSGLVTAAQGVQALSTGLVAFASAGMMAVAILTNLGTGFTQLSAQMTGLPPALSAVSAGLTAFAGQAMASMASLTALVAPVGLFRAQILTLAPAVLMAGAGFVAFSAQALMASSAMTQLAASATRTQATVMALGTAIRASMTGAVSAITSAGAQMSSAMQSAMSRVTAAVRSGMTSAAAAVRSGGSQMSSAMQTSGQQMATVMQASMMQIASSVRSGMSQVSSAIQSAGQQMVAAMQSAGSQLVSVTQSAVNQAASVARGGYGAFFSAGAYMGQGLAAGLQSALGAVTAAANALVAQAERAARAKAQIHSPSRLFKKNVGWWIGAGIAEGIDNSSSEVTGSLDFIRDQVHGFNVKANNLIQGVTDRMGSRLELTAKAEQAKLVQQATIMGQAVSDPAGASKAPTNNQYTLNYTANGGEEASREQMKRIFKEFAWYMQQEQGRLGGF